MIYLDYAANTPLDPEALKEYIYCEENYIANPNSNHPLGLLAREKLSETMENIALLLKVKSAELILTSGASEANNTAIKGIAALGKGKHIITSPLEHSSVKAPLDYLEKQGYKKDVLSVDKKGRIDLDELDSLISPDTCLVAVTAVDSETGTVLPIKEIAEIVKKHPDCRLHVDGTQAVGKIPFSLDTADTLSLSAHKLNGPNGIGLLYKKSCTELLPLIHGSGFRSGTPALSLAAAFEKALGKAVRDLDSRYSYVKKLNSLIREELKNYAGVKIISPDTALPHILNISVAGVKATKFRDRLAERGVCVSVRSACSVDGGASESVLALTGNRRTALSSWRISLSHLSTTEEVKEFLAVFHDCYKDLVKQDS